jgi:beta propeller repeat protein
MKNNTIHLLLLVLSMSLVGWTAASAQPVITLSNPVQLTTDPAAQIDPAVSGDIVVYTDLRHGNEEIYFYDLSSNVETRLTTSAPNQRLNDVSGSRIVYSDYTPPGAHIKLYDVDTGQTDTITSEFAGQNPRIDGDFVVIERGPPGSVDVIAIDLSLGVETPGVIPVATTSAQEVAPVVSGRRVAYERHATGAAPGEIVVVDLDTPALETVLGDPALDDRRPDTDGNLVVWDVMTAAGDYDIAIHDLSTGITKVLEMPGNQRGAHVSGRIVVFDDDSSGTSDVLMYHADSEQTIPVATGPGVEFLNDISRGLIVYTSNAAGNFDVWLVEFEVLSFDPPGGLEFGSVNVGSSQMQIVTLEHMGGDLEVSGLALHPWGSTGFSIGLSAPRTVGRGDTLDIPVTFAPAVAGPATNTLVITTDAGTVEVPLSGTGVSVAPPPQQQIAEILAFFDASVAAGTLVGSGNGNSASGRRKALRNMIEAAGDLIQQGRIEDACRQLADAANRTDGAERPPDFVEGPAAAELRVRIELLRSTLGCSN